MGGRWVPDGDTATAADGHEIAVCGRGELAFELWGTRFVEPVRVAEHLPSKVLVRSRFWRRHGLVLNLRTFRGKLWVDGRRIRGKVTRSPINNAALELMAAITDADVDDAILDMDLSQFHPEREVQEKLRKILWNRRTFFKGLGRIGGVQHRIKLVEGATPVCCLVRRRSPREEEVERAEMEKLLRMGVVEPASSPWAACNVFVKKRRDVARNL